MSYCKSKNCWTGLKKYNLNGCKNKPVEEYAPRVTLSLPQWQQYVASGNNVLLGSGGVIPGGTTLIPFDGNGSVYSGHVRQGW